MIAKEWQDARWKFLIAAGLVVLLVFLLSPYEEFVKEASRMPAEDPVENALRDLSDLYYLGGFFVLLPLAALLGVTSISGEVSNGTILLLLSRPVSRTRLLLTKYVVGAGTLLVAAVLGKALLVGVAAIRRYPLGQMRVLEAVLSVFVLWLGVLSVLGLALLVSVVFRGVVTSISACVLSLLLVFALPWYIVALVARLLGYPTNFSYGLPDRVALLTYWMPSYYYSYSGVRLREDYAAVGIAGFTTTNILVCLIAAAVPLLAALWLFGRKSY
jgi:ABC-type transport system involved in multi-copper enzyme maturation permease subunit